MQNLEKYNHKDLEKYRMLMEKRRGALLQVVEEAADASDIVQLDQSRVGRLSRMDALQSQAMAIESQRRRDRELQRIAAALERIESGNYGYCLACGGGISAQRLDVDPANPLCIACAENADQKR